MVNPEQGKDDVTASSTALSEVTSGTPTLPAHVLMVVSHRIRPYLTLSAAEKAIQRAHEGGFTAHIYLGRVEWSKKATPDTDRDAADVVIT